MNKEIFLSVIIPVYNTGKYIDNCLNSISKLPENTEIICVNDGSTDNSLEICEKHSKIDNRILCVTQQNRGVSAARNHGIDSAKGKYITFVDSDDYIEADVLMEMCLDLEKSGADASYSITRYDGDDLNTFYHGEKKELEHKEALDELVKGNFVSSADTVVYRRDALKNVRFDTDVRYWEDFHFQLKVLLRSQRIVIFDKPYYHVVKHDESATAKKVGKTNLTCLRIADSLEKCEGNIAERWLIETVRYKMLADLISGIIRKGIDTKEKKTVLDRARKESRICVKEFNRSRYSTFKGRMIIRLVSVMPKLLLLF